LTFWRNPRQVKTINSFTSDTGFQNCKSGCFWGKMSPFLDILMRRKVEFSIPALDNDDDGVLDEAYV
jgi:hypothetical protein